MVISFLIILGMCYGCFGVFFSLTDCEHIWVIEGKRLFDLNLQKHVSLNIKVMEKICRELKDYLNEGVQNAKSTFKKMSKVLGVLVVVYCVATVIKFQIVGIYLVWNFLSR